MLPGRESQDFERFREGKIITLANRTRQSRRFSMVASSDAVISIAGGGGTRQVLDLALAIDKPILPLPFEGGSSEEAWSRNRAAICEWFALKEEEARALEDVRLEGMSPEALPPLSDRVTECLLRGYTRNCFVIMPYAEQLNAVFDSAIRPVVESRGLLAVRPDRLGIPGDAVDTLVAALTRAHLVVADLTGSNPNVLYELGIAHALGKTVIIICQAGERGDLTGVPFDLRTQYIIDYGNDLSVLAKRLGDSLDIVLGRRTAPGGGTAI